MNEINAFNNLFLCVVEVQISESQRVRKNNVPFHLLIINCRSSHGWFLLPLRQICFFTPATAEGVGVQL